MQVAMETIFLLHNYMGEKLYMQNLETPDNWQPMEISGHVMEVQ